jgi:hypothetical protein
MEIHTFLSKLFVSLDPEPNMREFEFVEEVMKPRLFSQFAATVALFAALSFPLHALDTAQPAPPAENNGLKVPAPQPSKNAWMSREASDVLKLVRASVNEDVVMAYIENTRTGFNLSADEIVQLHNEGVSDKMINAMLAHRKQIPQVIAAAPQTAAPEAAQQQMIAQQPATVVTQPQVTYVQSQPVYVPAPTTYSYVYSQPYYSYYDPLYWNYWPRVSYNFGYRGGFYGRSYYPHYAHYAPHSYGGGFHGGWSGGFHGGWSGGHGGWSGGHGGWSGGHHR